MTEKTYNQHIFTTLKAQWTAVFFVIYKLSVH